MKSALIAAVVAAIVSASAATATTAVVITGAQIKDGSVQAKDLSRKARRSLRGQRGLRGLRGATGPAGPTGAAGAPGAPGANGGFDPTKVRVVQGATFTVPPNGGGSGTAVCAQGETALSGGWTTVSDSIVEVYMNRVGAVTYFISAWNYDMVAPATVEPYVVCAAR